MVSQITNDRKIFNKNMTLSNMLLNKHPDRIPVIIEKNKNDKGPVIDKTKYLVLADMTVAQFLYVIKSKISITENSTIYFFSKKDNKTLLSGALTFNYLYNNYKDDDGFLYLEYCYENVFG
jgi:GABA(A) receptor-associated protein